MMIEDFQRCEEIARRTFPVDSQARAMLLAAMIQEAALGNVAHAITELAAAVRQR